MQNADSTPEKCKLQALSVVYNDGDALLLNGKPLDKTNGFGREREARDRERGKRGPSRAFPSKPPHAPGYIGVRRSSHLSCWPTRGPRPSLGPELFVTGSLVHYDLYVPRQDLIRQLLLPNTVCRASGTSRRRVWFYALKRKGTKAPVRIARRPYS